MGRRRSGNFGPELSNEDPFDRAATYLKKRRDFNAQEVLTSRSSISTHTEDLSAAIAGSCLALPIEVRQKVWPSYFNDMIDEEEATSPEPPPQWPLDEGPPPAPLVFL